MTPHPKHANKEGIALIIVIGFLSVLLILAVAFVISMRTESLATRGYVDSIKSRQLMNVALARAMDDIEQDLTNNHVVYATWPAHASTNSSGSMSANLLDDSASGYVPRSLLLAATNEAGQARWRNITNNDRRVIGRYSYLAVDCSGLLDVNNVGGLPRSQGTNSFEISPDNQLFPEILASPVNENMWTEKYSRWIQYESLAELTSLGTTNPVFVSGSPSGLFTFSYFPAAQFFDYATGLPSNSLYIGGSHAYLNGISADIRGQFAAMSVPNALKLTEALLDYVDENNVPLDLFDICVEPTPLVNEVAVDNKITKTDIGGGDFVWTNAYQVWVELWFPFVGTTNTHDYELTMSAQYQGGSPPEFIPPAIATIPPIVISPPFGQWRNGEYYITNLPWSTTLVSLTNIVPLMQTARVQFGFRLRELGAGGGVVDQLQAPGMYLSNGVAIAAAASVDGDHWVGKGVNDPRLNWNGIDPNQWAAETLAQITMPGHNVSCLPDAAGCDGLSATNIYIRNGPLQTVGELGFLLPNKANPWQTIRLLDDNVNSVPALPVLDRFTLVTQPYLQGLVNPNTFDQNVLGAVFLNVRPEAWPGQNPTPLTAAQAQTVAQAIISNVTVHGFYTNLSEIAKITVGGITSVLSGTVDLDLNQEEGIIRNSAGLLSPRQNLFTILLGAQAVDSVTNVAGEQEAVALVWRDPYPTQDPYSFRTTNHAAFVRFFKVLTE